MSAPDDKNLMAHDYDGIREYDNPTPGWWKAIFLICCVWAAGYWFYYQLGPGLSEAESYEEDEKAYLSTVQSTSSTMDETGLDKLIADASALALGNEVYAKNCAACHRNDGGGLVGPNLTDDHQIHGSSKLDVYNVIRTGVSEKGMIAWELVLRPEDLNAVAAFVFTLRSTNVANGKAAEGAPVGGGEAPATE